MVARRGTEIEYRCSDEVTTAYVANPHSGTGAGVLVVHDERGLNDFARDVCDRLARADFIALAPDLLRGQQASEAAAADRLAKELDTRQALELLDAGVTELFNQHGTNGRRIGVLGFGVGGQLALALAGQNARVGAVVDFYGWHPDLAPDFDALAAPVFAVFTGGQPTEESLAARLEADLTAAGARYSVQTRSELHTGFMDDGRPDVHDAVAEFESWNELLAFFRAELS
jgi:carboxymethylenebutenolidase